VTIGTFALKYGPAIWAGIKGLFGGGSTPDYAAIEKWLMTQRPDGYVTAEDIAAADRTQSRLAGAAENSGVGARYGALARMRQRGIDTAPASEATMARISQQVAAGKENAANTGADQLYSTWLGNKQFEQTKALALANARLGGVQRAADRATAERAGAMNSLLGYIPSLLGTDKTTTSTVSGPKAMRYNPATGQLEDASAHTYNDGYGASDNTSSISF